MDGNKILFVCSANVNRSTTAELWFSWRNRENDYKSAGSNRFACNKYGGNLVTRKNLNWADRVICMEDKNKKEIQDFFGNSFDSKMEVAGIKDNYKFLELDLIFEFIEKIKMD